MITIRKANSNDAQAIFDLRNRAILAKCSAHYTEEQLSLWTQGSVSERFVADVVDTFYVSEIDGQVIGSGKLNTQTGLVDAIFVEPDYSGRGAAKKMLQFLEHLAKEQGLRLLTLESTLNAAPFYRACGFVGDEVSTYHSQKGIRLDCVSMEKLLLTQHR
ncbi:GNAT family N-acetyltransferase [Salinivibrio kushneri]|uniref:GNAT family N-acetyltransferase n=1 Tax=Salinivibrio kushneri TaxID=1908198 RepID=UPI000988CB9A|nr:GNAT family N-acetyltransferase [Salinivibrio kushneri]OOE51921.1 GNAT family N-acetyltransferase [Salinivibrio kushneri]OOE52653.1 GNAT family N-acetyltransferase [Salinivibrio kushneri]